MTVLVTTKALINVEFIRLFDRLPTHLGSALSDYQMEFAGDVPDYLKLSTELVGITTQDLQDVVDAYDILNLISDLGSIAADDLAIATLTCNDAVIAGDTDLDYFIWVNGSIPAGNGTVSVIGGTISLEFSTDVPGIYLIEIRRQGVGNYEIGFVNVEAI